MKKTKFGMSTCIGETVIGLPYPVFYDPHYPILNNRPPVSLITGSPGSGKTFFGLTLASQASVLGKVGMVIDPKGDFTALKKLEKKGLIGKIEIWSVADLDGNVLDENVGMLDPTTFTNNINDNVNLTLDIITFLVGELTPAQRNEVTPIIRDIAESPTPSFLRVSQKLMTSRRDEIRSLGYSLDTLLQTTLAKLIVRNKRIEPKKIELDKGLIVANLMGLTIPPDTKAVKEYKANEKISVTIVTLLCQLVLDLMGKIPKSIYKVLIIDEAWFMTAMESGMSMIKTTARLGRSLNLAMILLTQSTKHLTTGTVGDEESDINTMISVRFAFRNTDEQDNIKTCQYMKLPKDNPWEQLITSLETGECLMQDIFFNVNKVHVMAEDDWIEVFNTNPIETTKTN